MSSSLATGHQLLGYAVVIVVLLSGVAARRRAQEAREFRRAPYTAALVLMDIQVLLGFIVYGTGSAWDMRPEVAYVHPVLALLGLAVGHALLGRAKGIQLAVEAHRAAGRALLLAFGFIAAAVVIAAVPAFI